MSRTMERDAQEHHSGVSDELVTRLEERIAGAKRWAHANGGWDVTVSIDDLETLIRCARRGLP